MIKTAQAYLPALPYRWASWKPETLNIFHLSGDFIEVTDDWNKSRFGVCRWTMERNGETKKMIFPQPAARFIETENTAKRVHYSVKSLVKLKNSEFPIKHFDCYMGGGKYINAYGPVRPD